MSSPPTTLLSTVSTSAPARASGFWQDILGCFRSVQLAIVLLSLLAVGTIIGSTVLQEGSHETADIQTQLGQLYPLWKTLGFTNVFSSFWFLTLQVLFFFNLLIGSFKWLKPATLAALHKTCLPATLLEQKPEAHSIPFLLEGTPLQVENQITPLLKRFHYGIHRDGQGNVYASKGNITRLGPAVAHVGILLCLLAGLYSTFNGFDAFNMALPGEHFGIQNAQKFHTNVPKLLWTGSVPDWRIGVKRFRIEYYANRPDVAKQYYSDLEIRSPRGKLLQTGTISVNHPLVRDHVTIYQNSFAPTGRFQVHIDGKPKMLDVETDPKRGKFAATQLPDHSLLLSIPFFAKQAPGIDHNFVRYFILKPGSDAHTTLKMPEFLDLNEGQAGMLHGHTLYYIGPEMATGLQMRKAPEIAWMYGSYLIIVLGAVLCFFSQRQLWLALHEVSPGRTAMIVYPKTNKARLSFRKELFAFEHALRAHFSPPPTPRIPA